MSVISMSNNTMDIYSVGWTQSDTGGNVAANTEEQTDVPCRKRNTNGQEREMLGRKGLVASEIFYCDYDAITVALDETFLIKFGDAFFDIIFVDNWNEDNKYFKIYVEERK